MGIRLIEWQQVSFKDEKERKKDDTPLKLRIRRQGRGKQERKEINERIFFLKQTINKGELT